MSADLDFKRKHAIGTVNSINWARLLAQVVYYFAGYFQATPAQRRARSTSPCRPATSATSAPATWRGRWACRSRRLVLATNENDVLDEFFRTGTYRVRSAAETYETSSPSMDISKASNFERFVFDLLGRDARADARACSAAVESRADLRAERRPNAAASRPSACVSGRSTHADRLATIRDVHRRFGEVIDPHTADGAEGRPRARERRRADDRPRDGAAAKFNATVREALGIDAPRPPRFAGIESLPRRFTTLPIDLGRLKALIAENG